MTMLEDIKTIIGVPVGTTAFDVELIFNLKAVISGLPQIGVEEYAGVTVDENSDWPAIADLDLGQLVQQFVVMKVKNEFNPKANQAISQTISEHMTELEGRIMLMVDELAEV